MDIRVRERDRAVPIDGIKKRSTDRIRPAVEIDCRRSCRITTKNLNSGIVGNRRRAANIHVNGRIATNHPTVNVVDPNEQ